jgi:hypothetical protein
VRPPGTGPGHVFGELQGPWRAHFETAQGRLLVPAQQPPAVGVQLALLQIDEQLNLPLVEVVARHHAAFHLAHEALEANRQLCGVGHVPNLTRLIGRFRGSR